MRQVAWNLLRNATEAMPGGGAIALAVEASGAPGDGWAVLRVSDRGSGIPPEDAERIFDPFYSTKVRGTGLGLAVVHRIVDEHGGTIEVQPRAGGGTTFLVRLPLQAPGQAVVERRTPVEMAVVQRRG
jgi:signal transduction histidine kinase